MPSNTDYHAFHKVQSTHTHLIFSLLFPPVMIYKTPFHSLIFDLKVCFTKARHCFKSCVHTLFVKKEFPCIATKTI